MFAPNEAPIKMINDKYRFRILAKSRYNANLYDIIGDLYSKYSKNGKNAAVSVDVNPQNMY